jgi:hypothetical protein
MFNHDNSEKKSFSQICQDGQAEPELIKAQMKEFIDIMTNEDGWEKYDDTATEAKMRYILECMENDGFFTFEMLEFMQRTILEDMMNSEGSPLNIPGLQEHSIQVRALAGIAMNLTNTAEERKAELCHENSGPYDFEPLIVYMTSSEDGSDYQTNAVVIEGEEGQDPMVAVRETLVKCYAKWGEPLVVSLVSDTYMREIGAYSETSREATTSLGDDFLTRPDSDVCQALASITYGFDEPFVTATASYAYNDKGMPEFFDHAFEVVDLEEMSKDKSDRGVIALEIRNFFHDIQISAM